jgi:hypothetical protein
VPYFVLISTIIHLVAVKKDPSNIDTKQKLSQGISDLEEMAECHGFAVRAIDALQYLATRWGGDLSPANASSQAGDLTDSRRSSSTLPDQFCPDVSILETLQSIQPVLSPEDPPLFSPFPMQGLPLVANGPHLEEEGFTLISRK